MTFCDAVRASEIRKPNAGRVQLVIHGLILSAPRIKAPTLTAAPFLAGRRC
jgi:hypothetical protein